MTIYVLVVDDSKTVCRRVDTLSGEAGYTAHAGNEACGSRRRTSLNSSSPTS